MKNYSAWGLIHEGNSSLWRPSTSPQLHGRELPPPRLNYLLAAPADVETQAWLRAGRQWVVGGACARYMPPPCSQLCIFFSHSTNICGKSDQGQLPGPFFVLPVRNSESDDVRFKSPTHSKCSCNYPSPPSTSCVLGTSLACEGDRVTLGKQSEDETRKWIKPANARSGPSVHSAGPLPSLPHEVRRDDQDSDDRRTGTCFRIAHVQGERAIAEHLLTESTPSNGQSIC